MMASERGASLADADWNRLHPASLLVNLVPQAWRVVKGFWPLLLVLFVGGRGGPGAPGDMVFLLGFLGLSVLSTISHYLTLRYRVREGRLEIKSGLLNRNTRILDPARIQNVSLVRNLFHKLSGLVELRIETAGDAGTEGLLSALSVEEARRLQVALESARGRELVEEDAVSPILTNGPLELIGFGLSQRRLGAVALFAAIGSEVLATLSPTHAQRLASTLGTQALLAIFLLAFAASWVLSAVSALGRHWGFRLLRQGDRLVTEEGLATRRRVEIPLQKVQLVTADEPLVRRWMGYGTVSVETAAISVEEGQLRQAEARIPMVPSTELGLVLATAAPGVDVDPWTERLRRPHPRALLRGLVRALLQATLLSGLLIGVSWTILGFSSLLVLPLLLPLALFSAWLDWRRQGWLVTQQAVISRRGFFNRRTHVLDRGKIQSASVVQGPLLRWSGLAVLVVRAAGGSSVITPEIAADEARAVLESLRPLEQQKLHGDDAGDHASHVSHEPGRDRAPEAGDPDRAEVDGQHVEGGLGRAVDGAGQVADVAVGPVGLDEVRRQREGARAGERAEEGERQHLAGHPKRRGEG